jgi:cell division protein FtsB
VSAGTRTLERSRPRLTGRAAALLVILAVLVLLALVPARRYLGQSGRIAELDRLATKLEQQNAELRSQIAELRDPVELERLARECLGMVKSGEILLVTPGGDRADDDC